MPRLYRLRLVSIGHPKARMDDLTLDMSDANGRAIDSTIWLRNGGGKSSVLNLFFSLLSPHRRTFLGAEQGERRLEDYIKPDDRGVVVAEWEMDGLDDRSTPHPRYLTGVFYEWVNTASAPEARKLRRLFFASRVLQQTPSLTLDGLALFSDSEGGSRRRTLNGFKQEWQRLGKAYPEAEIKETEHQQEWRDILAQARLDAELFGYQIRMNSREGGAADLFSFRDNEQFIDFFLELVLDHRHGAGVTKNIETYRSALRERRERLLPSLQLFQGLKPRLEPCVALAESRQLNLHQIGQSQQDILRLREYLHKRVNAFNTESEKINYLLSSLQEKIEKSQSNVEMYRHHILSMKQHAMRLKVERLSLHKHELQEKLEHYVHNVNIWKAATPLLQVDRCVEKLRGIEELINQKYIEWEPLLAELRLAAHTYVAALHAERRELSEQLHTIKQEANLTWKNSKTERLKVQEQVSIVGGLQERIQQLEQQIKDEQKSRSQLEGSSALERGESVGDAIARLLSKVHQAEQEQNVLRGETEELEANQRELEVERERVVHQEAQLQQAVETAKKQLDEALGQQHKIEHDVPLLRYLEIEILDAESLGNESLQLLKQARTHLDERLLMLRADIVDNERTVVHLNTSKLLPPSRDVETILNTLSTHKLSAWAGWEHVAQTIPPAQARSFIERFPELVQGVLVHDDHFDAAVVLLQQDGFRLDNPIVVASRHEVFQRDDDHDGQAWVVVGPTNSAHFDHKAAKQEQLEREDRLMKDRLNLEEVETEIHTLKQSTDQLENYLRSYPADWFVNQRTYIQTAEQDYQTCQSQLMRLSEKKDELLEKSTLNRNQYEWWGAEIQRVTYHLSQVEAHMSQHKDASELASQLSAAKAALDHTQLEVNRLNALGDECEQKARTLEDDARKLEQEAMTIERKMRPKYLEGDLPEPSPGDIEGLEDRYRQLRAIYESHMEESELAVRRRGIEEELERARTQFEQARESSIEESEVRRTLSQLENPMHAERQYRQALEALVNLKVELQKADEELELVRLNKRLAVAPFLGLKNSKRSFRTRMALYFQ